MKLHTITVLMGTSSLLMLVAALGLTQQGCSVEPSPSADTIYKNGKIYTVNKSQTWAEAVAIKDGEFIGVGNLAEIEAFNGPETKVVDLEGRFAMPGLHDTHVHMESAYTPEILGKSGLNFPSGKTVPELQAILKEFAANNPDEEILFGMNLPYATFPNASPTKAFIDEVISDRPVYLLTAGEHEGLMNTKALAKEGITAETQAPRGGIIVKDEKTGEPTGFVKESAAGQTVWKYFPQLTPEQSLEGLQGVIAYLNSVGITSVKQQHAKPPIATAAKKLSDSSQLNARVALVWTWMGPLEPMPIEEQKETILNRAQYASDLINTEYVKLSIDGNMGTTGYVVDPYLQSGTRGSPEFTDEELFEQIEYWDDMGMGVVGHAIADGSARQMIDAIARVKEKHGKVNARHQIAHAILIHPDDIPRMIALDITPEFSPVLWYPHEMAMANIPQLGEERMKRWFPMNSVAKQGGRFVIASDGPVAWHDPLTSMETAITRRAPGGKGDPLSEHEGVDLATAIKAMTLDSAYLMNQDQQVGSIEVGKRADMIVVDQNLFDIPATKIGATKVLLTVLDGRVVFDAASSPASEKAIEEKFGVELDLSGEFSICR